MLSCKQPHFTDLLVYLESVLLKTFSTKCVPTSFHLEQKLGFLKKLLPLMKPQQCFLVSVFIHFKTANNCSNFLLFFFLLHRYIKVNTSWEMDNSTEIFFQHELHLTSFTLKDPVPVLSGNIQCCLAWCIRWKVLFGYNICQFFQWFISRGSKIVKPAAETVPRLSFTHIHSVDWTAGIKMTDYADIKIHAE